MTSNASSVDSVEAREAGEGRSELKGVDRPPALDLGVSSLVSSGDREVLATNAREASP